MILELLSRRLATKIKEADPEGPGSVDVLTYGIGLKLNWYTCLILTALFGYLLDTLVGSFIALFSFVILRRFSGGVHLPITICSVITAAAALIIPYISLHSVAVVILNLFSLIIILVYAPNFFEYVYPSKWDAWRKWISALIVCGNFYLLSDVMALAFSLQALLIAPLWPKRREVMRN